MSLPNKKYLVDTNVAKTSNLATQPDPASDVPNQCVLACIEAVEHVVAKRSLVLDDGDEIFDEYRRQLSMSGQPGLGDRFMKWVHDHRHQLHDSQKVPITRNGESYDEFPDHPGLADFDKSDRKFVAVANAHNGNPEILQATDSKWWGWQHALNEAGVAVRFVCPEYAKTKYAEKMAK